MKMAVAEIGHVGFLLEVLLAQQHEVSVVDIHPEKVDVINLQESAI